MHTRRKKPLFKVKKKKEMRVCSSYKELLYSENLGEIYVSMVSALLLLNITLFLTAWKWIVLQRPYVVARKFMYYFWHVFKSLNGMQFVYGFTSDSDFNCPLS